MMVDAFNHMSFVIRLRHSAFRAHRSSLHAGPCPTCGCERGALTSQWATRFVGYATGRAHPVVAVLEARSSPLGRQDRDAASENARAIHRHYGESSLALPQWNVG